MAEYLANTAYWEKVGNSVFARMIASRLRSAADPIEEPFERPKEPFILYHAWRPGMLGISERLSGTLRAGAMSQATGSEGEAVELLKRSGWLRAEPVDLDALVERAFTIFIAVQNRYELGELLRHTAACRPGVVVEIGTARGGLLYCLCQTSDENALLVSIDLPGAPNCGGQTETERRLYASFARPGQRVRFVPRNSRHWNTRNELQRILDGRPIDLLVIDGDHSYGGVRSDFEMYSGLVRAGGTIALHDIRVLPSEWGRGNDVGLFWMEIAPRYRSREIVDPGGTWKRDAGGKARAWGLGLIEAGTGTDCP
jgi:hypothetical protein